MIISIRKLKKPLGIFLIALSLIIACALIINAISDNKKKNEPQSVYPDNYSRIAYLNLLGWDVEETPVETVVTIPYEFNDVYTQYNELQLKQGFDLSRHKGEEVTKYDYVVKNYKSGNETITASILIQNDEIIGGDIHTSSNGLMYALDELPIT